MIEYSSCTALFDASLYGHIGEYSGETCCAERDDLVRVPPGQELRRVPPGQECLAPKTDVFDRLHAAHAAKLGRHAIRREMADQEECERADEIKRSGSSRRLGTEAEADRACSRLYNEAELRRRRAAERQQQQDCLGEVQQALAKSRSMPRVTAAGSFGFTANKKPKEPAWERLHAFAEVKEQRLEMERQKAKDVEERWLEDHNIHHLCPSSSSTDAFERLYYDGAQRELRMEQLRSEEADEECRRLQEDSVHRTTLPAAVVEQSCRRLHEDADARRARLDEQRRYQERRKVEQSGTRAPPGEWCARFDLLYNDASRRKVDRLSWQVEQERMERVRREHESVHAPAMRRAATLDEDEVKQVFNRISQPASARRPSCSIRDNALSSVATHPLQGVYVPQLWNKGEGPSSVSATGTASTSAGELTPTVCSDDSDPIRDGAGAKSALAADCTYGQLDEDTLLRIYQLGQDLSSGSVTSVSTGGPSHASTGSIQKGLRSARTPPRRTPSNRQNALMTPNRCPTAGADATQCAARSKTPVRPDVRTEHAQVRARTPPRAAGRTRTPPKSAPRDQTPPRKHQSAPTTTTPPRRASTVSSASLLPNSGLRSNTPPMTSKSFAATGALSASSGVSRRPRERTPPPSTSVAASQDCRCDGLLAKYEECAGTFGTAPRFCRAKSPSRELPARGLLDNASHFCDYQPVVMPNASSAASPSEFAHTPDPLAGVTASCLPQPMAGFLHRSVDRHDRDSYQEQQLQRCRHDQLHPQRNVSPRSASARRRLNARGCHAAPGLMTKLVQEGAMQALLTSSTCVRDFK